MKIKVSILYSLLLLITVSHGQSNILLNDFLNESIERILSQNNKNQAVFLVDNFPSNFQFSKKNIDTFNVTFFNKNNYKKSELKRGIRTFRLLPFFLKDGSFSISISNVFVTQKAKNITISSADFYTYEYQYSCEKRQWELLEIKESGF